MVEISSRDVLTVLTATGLATILQTLVLPRLLDHLMSHSLEKFKAELHAAGFERDTHFAWFHAERAKAMMRIYEKLGDVRTASHAIAEAASLARPQEDLQNELRQSLDELVKQLNRTQIFFDAALRERIRCFAQESYEAAGVLKRANDVYDPHFQIWKEREMRLAQLLGDIEATFRELLSSSLPEGWQIE